MTSNRFTASVLLCHLGAFLLSPHNRLFRSLVIFFYPPAPSIHFAVAGFARQTGDLGALSRVDIRVIALTYMLERQETGGSHLRAAPVRPVRHLEIVTNGQLFRADV